MQTSQTCDGDPASAVDNVPDDSMTTARTTADDPHLYSFPGNLAASGGRYWLCWCGFADCSVAANFKVPVGRIVVRGPDSAQSGDF